MITRCFAAENIKSRSDPLSLNPSLRLPLNICMVKKLGVASLFTISIKSSVSLLMATFCEVPIMPHSPTNTDSDMCCRPSLL